MRRIGGVPPTAPQVTGELFRRVAWVAKEHGAEFGLSATFVEVAGDRVYDLLSPQANIISCIMASSSKW